MKRIISFILILSIILSLGLVNIPNITFAAGSTTGLADSAFTYGALNGTTEVGAYPSATWASVADIFSETGASSFNTYKANSSPTTAMWFMADFGGVVNVNTINVQTIYGWVGTGNFYLSETLEDIDSVTPIAGTLTNGATRNDGTAITAEFPTVSARYLKIKITEEWVGQFSSSGIGLTKIYVSASASVTPTPTSAAAPTPTTGATPTPTPTPTAGATPTPAVGAGSTRGLSDSAFTFGALNGITEVGATATATWASVADIFSETGATSFRNYKADSSPASVIWFVADFGGLVHVNGINMQTAHQNANSCEFYLSENKEDIDSVTPIVGTITNNTSGISITATSFHVTARYLKIKLTESYSTQFATSGIDIKKIDVTTTNIAPPPTLSISGTASVGGTITATATGLSSYTTRGWQFSDSEVGTYTDITGVTSKSITIESTMQGKYIRYMVSNGSENMYSNVIGPIQGEKFSPVNRPDSAYTTTGVKAPSKDGSVNMYSGAELKVIFREYDNNILKRVQFDKTSPDGFYVQVDCGGIASFDTIKVRTLYTKVFSYEISVSNDGVKFNQYTITPRFIDEVDNGTEHSTYYSKDVLGEAISARYIRFKPLTSDNLFSNWGLTLVNLEFLMSSISEGTYSINGLPAIGETLSAKHTFLDSLRPTVRWLVSSNGISFDVEASTNDFILKDTHKGKYIKMRVLAEKHNSSEMEVHETPVIGPVDYYLDKPKVSNIRVLGNYTQNFEVGDVITFSYAYEQRADVKESGSIVTLKAYDDEGAFITLKSENVTSTTTDDMRYLISQNELGKTLKIEITPKFTWNNQEVLGDTEEKVIGIIEATTEKPPVLEALTVIGNFYQGSEIQGQYAFYDANGDAEGNTKYEWLSAKSVSSTTWNVIKSGTAKAGDILTYKITSADVNNFIKLSVIPVSVKAPTTGNNAYTSAKLVRGMPGANNPWIWSGGKITANTVLEAKYTYTHLSNIAEGDSVISWYKNGTKIAEGRNYQVNTSDVGAKLKFGVIPKATEEPYVGNEVFSSEVLVEGIDLGTSPKSSGPSTRPTSSAISTAVITTIAQPENVFRDIANHWAKDSIEAIKKLGIVEGTGDGNFLPDKHTTRAEGIKIIIGMLNEKPENLQTNFSDVSDNDWFAGYVQKASNLGFINTDANIRPNDALKREEMAKMIVIAYNMPIAEDVELPFDDLDDADETLIKYVKTAYKNGILKGISEKEFDFKSPVTRAQMSVIALRVIENGGTKNEN